MWGVPRMTHPPLPAHGPIYPARAIGADGEINLKSVPTMSDNMSMKNKTLIKGALAAALFVGIGILPLMAEENLGYDAPVGEAMTVDYGTRLLYNGTCEDRLFAIDVFHRNRNTEKEVIDGLIECLHCGTIFKDREAGRVVNDFWEVRYRSAQALGDIAKKPSPLDRATVDRVLFELHKALRYEHEPVVKAVIALSIGEIGQSRSIPHLARAVEVSMSSGTAEDDVVISCAQALGEIGDKDGYWILYRIVTESSDREVRAAAQEALNMIK
jgi:hypothetical protein